MGIPWLMTSPYFGTSFGAGQLTTYDFLSYLETGALELQVWGAVLPSMLPRI